MINRNLVYALSIISLSVFLLSCGNKNKGVLSKDQMVAVLHDIKIAEAIQKTRSLDFDNIASKDAILLGVLNKHNITQAELDSSLVWYSDNVEVYTRVNDSIIATLNREITTHGEYVDKRMYRRRSVNFSIIPDFYYLTPTNPTLPFVIDAPSMSRYPDFEIQFKTLWAKEDLDTRFSISFVYPDTTLVVEQKIDKDGLYKFGKPEKTEPLKYVYGNIHIDGEDVLGSPQILLYDIAIRDSIKQEIVEVDEILQEAE